MRLFIAVEIPEHVKSCLRSVQKHFQGGIFKLPKSFHLTLKFLGDVADLDKVKARLSAVKFNAFKVSLGSLGVFSEDHVRVVWVSLKPENPVSELQKAVDSALRGLFPEEPDFKPHITVARVKKLDSRELFLEQLNKIPVEQLSFQVSSFDLIKSTLTPEGPVYETLAEFKAQPL